MSDTPEEPDEGEPGPGEGGGQGADEPEAPLRGWIDPDDRLWRHPSEVTGGGPGTGEVPVLLNAPPRHPYRGAVMVLVGVVAVMAVIAWVVVLLSPASTRPLSTTHDTAAVAPTTLAGPQNAVPAVAQAAGRSMVELRATTGQGTVAIIGIAVAEGGLVATTADLPRRRAQGGDGRARRHARAGHRGGDGHGVRRGARDRAPGPPGGTVRRRRRARRGVARPDAQLRPAQGTSVALHCTPGAVTGVATAIASGPAGGMPSIDSSPAAPSVAAGDPLLNASGDVVGILYDTNPGSAGPATFLPSQLVVGVADDLRSRNRVVHGWLGVGGSDAPSGGGAKVVTVNADSPAQGKLAVGQVIVGVNAMPVRTMAELRARLYVLAPGAAVAVSVQQAAGTKVVDLTLGGSS